MCSVSVFNASARHLLSDFAQTREENKANVSVQRKPLRFLSGRFSLFNLYLMLQLRARGKKEEYV